MLLLLLFFSFITAVFVKWLFFCFYSVSIWDIFVLGFNIEKHQIAVTWDRFNCVYFRQKSVVSFTYKDICWTVGWRWKLPYSEILHVFKELLAGLHGFSYLGIIGCKEKRGVLEDSHFSPSGTLLPINLLFLKSALTFY